MKFAVPSVKPGLDPAHTTTGDGYMLTQAIFSNLTRIDENHEAKPQLARSREANPDASVWTFHLVPGGQVPQRARGDRRRRGLQHRADPRPDDGEPRRQGDRAHQEDFRNYVSAARANVKNYKLIPVQFVDLREVWLE